MARVAVNGSMLAVDSRVYFDSLPAVTRNFTGADNAGTLTVTPPVGFSGQVAAVTVYNSDGQNSTFAQPVPPQFAYGPAAVAGVPVQLLHQRAARGHVVDDRYHRASNTQFVDGQTTVGVGSSDITVRRVWVLSPNHLWANVVVAPNAAPGAYTATVLTGFQLAPQQFAFQVLRASAGATTNRPNILLPPVNRGVDADQHLCRRHGQPVRHEPEPEPDRRRCHADPGRSAGQHSVRVANADQLRGAGRHAHRARGAQAE